MNFKKTKITKVPTPTPFPNPVVADTAAVTMSAFVVKDNKGTGPQGQTSRHRSKKLHLKA